MDGSLSSSNGGIVVRTTERGLPIGLKIYQRELSKPPTQLAREILLLCQLSARRMQVARRRDLVARGFGPNAIRGLDLSTEEALTQAEAELRGEDSDGVPDTWMTPI
ncbi:hypothetical protein OK015_07920 [Mycobacterium sp. Aquia_216]|uniref:hypothetical protein n=1 Tax=Mycobacterium sp. Aquia_216 TaxID=2991729 RepID=UPI00227C8A34|nr:hypothetical protein [Mycobacterium sp. Aquia_216]WAJ46383.1 hypothetical protein OK015_07920 [Mycobacterium sp. Aquia_216]